MSREFNRLLNAALADRRFCELLLSNPKTALEEGYNDEQFYLTQEEQDFIFSIQATTLQELAAQLSRYTNNQIT
jgi:hypothetical protein